MKKNILISALLGLTIAHARSTSASATFAEPYGNRDFTSNHKNIPTKASTSVATQKRAKKKRKNKRKRK